jgi:hypothetical protein
MSYKGPATIVIQRKRKIRSRCDRAVLVAPASPEEAVTYHALAKQKEDDNQDNYKQELSNSHPLGLSSLRSRCIQPYCHQTTSGRADVLAITRLLMRPEAWSEATAVRLAIAVPEARELVTQSPQLGHST